VIVGGLKYVAVKTAFVFIMKDCVDCFVVGTECTKTQLDVLCYSYVTVVCDVKISKTFISFIFVC